MGCCKSKSIKSRLIFRGDKSKMYLYLQEMLNSIETEKTKLNEVSFINILRVILVHQYKEFRRKQKKSMLSSSIGSIDKMD
jgi:hypothetical protein